MRARKGFVFTAFLFFGLGLGSHAAFAQVPPIPPIPFPPIPPQTQPVFELIAPTVSPQCGTAALLIFLAGSSANQQGVELGPTVFSATTPVFVVCGAVPRPPQQLQCLIDRQVNDQLALIEGQVAGAGVPLGLAPMGSTVQQLITIEDKLPPPANSQELGARAVATFGCTVATQTAPSNTSFPPIEEPTSPAPYIPPFAPGLPGDLGGPIPAAPLPPVLAAPPVPTRPLGDAVTYASVWLLPLGLLLFGGYLGGAFTRDIELGTAARS
ncbi:MAG: hypothetical protein WAT66_10555 [Actinomycetota bacterium]